MRIKYSRYEATPSASNPPGVIVRPEVLLRIAGPSADECVMALVDTGADETILPLSLAYDLGIVVDVSSETRATSFAGGAIPLTPGIVELEIIGPQEIIRWQSIVQFASFESPEDECAVLGFCGALQYFLATFDGEAHELTLDANRKLPKLP